MNLAQFQDEVRRSNQLPDYIEVDGITYTMETYDSAGHEVTYCNKRTTNRITVHTADRYENGYSDALVELDENTGYYREDIPYAD